MIELGNRERERERESGGGGRDYIPHNVQTDTSKAPDNLNIVHFTRQMKEIYLVIYKRHIRYISYGHVHLYMK
jgi:hypothetical protein